MTAPRKTTAAKPTSVAAWKKQSQLRPTLMPSGNYMTIRRVGMNALIQTGMMPNSLLAYAEKAVAKGKAEEMSNEDIVDVLKDPKKLADITAFFDKLIVFAAVEPEVHPLPGEGVEKDDNLLYVDEVDEEDKMFVFQLVTGGTTSVEQFRGQLIANVDALRGSEDLAL